MGDMQPALDRAAAYGDGLFETMLAVKGAIPLLTYHRERLAQGVARLGGNLDQAHLWQDLTTQANSHSGVVKLNCYRSGGSRGYASAGSEWHYQIQRLPKPVYPLRYLQRGVVLQPLPQRLAFDPALASIKHTNRLAQISAADLLDKPLAQDALMLDDAGWVIEGLISNVAIVNQGQWITPALSGSGVAGTMRQYLLEHVSQMGLTPVVRPMAMQEIAQAEAVFVCNSIFGVWPVARIGLAPVSFNFALSQALWQLLAPLGYLAAYD